MARSNYGEGLESESYNSAGSQFFIMTKDNESLDGLYGSFGKVIEGMDIVNAIANVEVVTRDTEASEGVDRPVNPPVIKSITVDTFGVKYKEPKTLEPFDYYSYIMQQYYSDYNYDLDYEDAAVPEE